MKVRFHFWQKNPKITEESASPDSDSDSDSDFDSSSSFSLMFKPKKFVLKLDLHDDKAKQKAMKTVSTLPGIDSISIDINEKKLTIIGTVDPVSVVSKLRKYWQTDIISVGPAKEPEPEKKEEPKKEEGKKEEEPKKEEEAKKEEEPKKEGEKKEEEKKKEPPPPDPVMELVNSYRAYNPHMTSYYYVQSMEENPNSCVIC